MAARLAVIAVVASLAQDAVAHVDCGGHFEYSCSACPAGNGELWCNGDCAWVSTSAIDGGGECVPKMSVGLPDTEGTYYYLSAFFGSGIIMLIYACFYNQMVIKGPPALPKVNLLGTVPRKGLFECMKYPLDTCLYVMFCMPIVAAKNYYAAEVCAFWPGCILTFLSTYSPLFPIGVVIRAILSGRVQDKLGVKHECFMDFLYAIFCFPCDVGRESLEVDQEIGADIRCCCRATITLRAVQEAVNVVEKVEQKVERSCEKYRLCPGGGGH